MATLVGPMMSVVARGSIGNAITFKCGTVAAKKKIKKNLRSDQLSEQQQLFKDGAAVWSEDLSDEVQKEWFLVGVRNVFDLRCNPSLLALPFLGILPLAAPLIGVAALWKLGINGYDLWISYYLTLGANGWPNYPSPPPIGWRPTQTRRGKTP
jgi:hypothetical protein